MKAVVCRVCFAVLVALMVATAGCESVAAGDMENMLAAAGFSKRVAQTPEQMEKLADLPQRELFRSLHDERVYFIYADATYCRCMYVGDEAAHQRYEELALERRIARKRVLQEDFSGMRLGVWGPWDPL